MVREVDFRSDVVTKPTAAMRLAMAEAAVGNDVYQEDPTVNALQEKAAKLLGKEEALFVPSGTMGNLSAIMAHCWTRGQEILVGDQTHIFISEQGGASQIAGVHVSALKNLKDGTFELEEFKEKLRSRDPISHEPATGLVCLENTNNRCGGRVLPLSFIQQVCDIAKRNGVPVHMDGARILNAAVYYGTPVHEIVKGCDSVLMCLCKGVGAPVGSIVAGSKEFIARVHRCRKVLGGGMAQAGVLAAAAIVALDSAHERIRLDHQRAKQLAYDIFNLRSKLLTVDPTVVDSNIILLNFPSSEMTSQRFVCEMTDVDPKVKGEVAVLASTWFKNRVRLVFHSDISQEDLNLALNKIKSIVL